MKAAQFFAIAEILKTWNIPPDRGANFSQWTNRTHVSLMFMDNDGTVQRFDIQRNGEWERTTD